VLFSKIDYEIPLLTKEKSDNLDAQVSALLQFAFVNLNIFIESLREAEVYWIVLLKTHFIT